MPEDISENMQAVILTNDNRLMCINKQLPKEIYKIADEYGYQLSESVYFNGKLYTYTFVETLNEYSILK